MRKIYEQELKQLNDEMLDLGSLIVKAIEMAIDALINGKVTEAEDAINFDDKIDHKDKDIENLCMKLLLTQQPVATDLRRISSAMKMVTDMERIGDHAADISEITLMLSGQEYSNHLEILKQMASETTSMVIKSLEAFTEGNMDKAKEVIDNDDVVDDLFIKEKEDVVQIIAQNSADGNQATDLLMVAKYFERIGDHATNIAEWVIYSITGDLNVVS